jgi:hypothetical protein
MTDVHDDAGTRADGSRQSCGDDAPAPSHAADRPEDQTSKGRGRRGKVPAQRTPEVMDLLSEHVPLALLADLADPDGPASPVILESEGLPDKAWWERPDEVGEAGDDRH